MGEMSENFKYLWLSLTSQIHRASTESAALKIARDQKSISLVKTAEATYAEYCRQKANSSEGRGSRVPLW
jgi:hypothetical protein